MANPQLENGYTRIANELLEAIMRQNLTSGELKVVLAIVRKTYGFGKKSDKIPYQQIANLVDMPRRSIIRICKRLQGFRIIISDKGVTRTANKISINKNYSEWCNSDIKRHYSDKPVTRVVTPVSPELVTPVSPSKEKKETITKEIIRSQIENLRSSFPVDNLNLLDDFFELMAIENKTGKLTAGRKLSEMNKLYNVYLANESKFTEALEITVKNQAPNVNYIKAVLKGFKKKKFVQQSIKIADDKKAMEEARLRSQKDIELTQKMLTQQEPEMQKAGFIK